MGDGVELAGQFVPLLIADVAAPILGDFGEHRFVEVDGLIEELGAVLQDDDPLGLIVIDGRGVMLDLLLQLLQIAPGFDLHDGEDDAGDDAAHPQSDLEQSAPPVGLDRDLLLDDVDVFALRVNRASHFV